MKIGRLVIRLEQVELSGRIFDRGLTTVSAAAEPEPFV
jgi:hypothetical protein